MIDSGLFMNTDNEKLVSDLNDVFKQFSVTPQEQEEIMKEVGVNVKIESIASAIAKFLYSAKSKIDILDYEVREENKRILKIPRIEAFSIPKLNSSILKILEHGRK